MFLICYENMWKILEWILQTSDIHKHYKSIVNSVFIIFLIFEWLEMYWKWHNNYSHLHILI